MSDILNISSAAVSNYQKALSTVSNNIANVNTEGYSRQETVIQDTSPAQYGNTFVGTGAMVQTIKRDFDNFVEQSLRNSNSDLSAQKPMVDYSKQVMDVMGDQTIGLSSALDSFFSSANSLASNPASVVQRNAYLQSATGVASRFATLSTQMDSISTQATQSLTDDVSQFNTLTAQLAVINKNLMQQPDLQSQPAQLLDNRDLTLEKLSKLMKINTTFSANGLVTVSLGANANDGVVTDATGKSFPIGVQNDASGQPNLILDPYGSAQPLPNATGGEIAGYQQVMSQIINTTQSNLNKLAQTFVTEANNIQKSGIDGYGELGQNLFNLDPNATQAAAGVSVALTDPQRVAAASQFGVSPGASNVGTGAASVTYAGTTPTTAVSNAQLVNNPNPTAAITVPVTGASEYAPVTTLSAGVDAVFYLDSSSPGQQLQVVTKDGRQLLGQSLTQTQQYQMMTTANGFAANATFSNQYLNQTGANAYRGEDMFYGAKASTQNSPVYDNNGVQVSTKPVPASMLTGRLNGVQNIPAGALQLNGVPLPAFQSTGKSSVSLSGMTLIPQASGVNFNFHALLDGRVINVSLTPAQAENMTSLQSTLQSSLANVGLQVQFTHSGQDLQILDPQGRNLTDVSLAPVTGATISGVTFPSTMAAPFTFNTVVSGKSYSFSNFTAGNLNDLANQLESQMAQAGLQGMQVSASGNDLQITDMMGRDVTGAYFSTTTNNSSVTTGTTTLQSSAGASAATVTINNDANQVAQWVNGNSDATFSGITFDSPNPLPFSQFSATIGQTNFTFNNLQSTDINSLAAELQTNLRAQDGSSNLSVVANGNTLQITDAQGRTMSNFALTPATDDPTASGGTVAITQSVQQQTGVQAQVSSTITVPISQIKTTQPLVINGQTVSGYQSIDQLVTAINASGAGVVATLNNQGQMVLTDPQGGTIHIDPTSTPNALGIDSGDYSPQVNMVKVIPDMTIDASTLDFSKPLTVNGINFGQASYSLPAAGSASFTTEFGTIDQTSYDPTTLQSTLNDKSTQTLTGVSFGNQLPINPNMFQSFSVKVGTQTYTLNNLSPATATLTDLASEIQAGLQKLDNSSNLTVTTDGSGTLSVTDGSNPPRAITGLGLNISDAGMNAQASVGTVQPRFSDHFVASVSGQTLSVTSLDPTMTDGQIASQLFVQSNGQQLQSLSSVTDKTSLLARFSALQSETGVAASLDATGNIVLTTLDPTAQANISIGPGKDAQGHTYANMLGVTAQDYDPSQRLQMKQASDPNFKPDVRMSFGTYGTPPNTQSGDPSMMQSLGLRTAAYIQSGSADDLQVFVTGKGTAQVSASYSGQPNNQLDSLRKQNLEVKFTAAGRYNIIDSSTGTVLADRTYDPSQTQPEIDYEGLKFSISSTPTVGDTYSITGNFDGTGNNVAMLQMVSLAKKPVLNNKSIGDSYVNEINSVGEISQQATITQQALQAVNDQATTAKSNASGVNLDEEATSLIRYQQAYQAAAKALQISGQIFDSIVQIN